MSPKGTRLASLVKKAPVSLPGATTRAGTNIYRQNAAHHSKGFLRKDSFRRGRECPPSGQEN